MKPPPDFVYFFDRNMGKVAGQMLQDAGMLVELHDDHFSQDTSDEKLLTAVGERGWLFITKDKRIRHRKLERNAVVASNLRVFVLPAAKKLTGTQMGELLVRQRAKIERLARRQKPPFIAGVYEWGVQLYGISKDEKES
jgi:hypothetical protein